MRGRIWNLATVKLEGLKFGFSVNEMMSETV
jgi:hypothetical protein